MTRGAEMSVHSNVLFAVSTEACFTKHICSDSYAKISRLPTGRPRDKLVNPLAYGLTYWPMGRLGLWVSLLTKRATLWPMGQPTRQQDELINSFRVFGFSFGKTNQFLSSLTFPVLNEVFVAALLFRSARNT